MKEKIVYYQKKKLYVNRRKYYMLMKEKNVYYQKKKLCVTEKKYV